MAVEVTTPDEHLGDVINDLQQRRAIITSTQNRGAITVVDAEAPLAAMFGYSMAVRSLSQGPREFFDGTAEIRPGAAGSARRIFVKVYQRAKPQASFDMPLDVDARLRFRAVRPLHGCQRRWTIQPVDNKGLLC